MVSVLNEILSRKHLTGYLTHIESGKLLDHLFFRKLEIEDVLLHHPYYTDYDSILAMFRTNCSKKFVILF